MLSIIRLLNAISTRRQVDLVMIRAETIAITWVDEHMIMLGADLLETIVIDVGVVALVSWGVATVIAC